MMLLFGVFIHCLFVAPVFLFLCLGYSIWKKKKLDIWIFGTLFITTLFFFAVNFSAFFFRGCDQLLLEKATYTIYHTMEFLRVCFILSPYVMPLCLLASLGFAFWNRTKKERYVFGLLFGATLLLYWLFVCAIAP